MSASLNPQAPDSSAHQAHGCHLLLECSGCEPDLLTDLLLLEQVLEKAASEAGATVVKTFLHEFNPHGLNGVVVIAAFKPYKHQIKRLERKPPE